MSSRPRSEGAGRLAGAFGAAALVIVAASCVRPGPFQRYLDEGRWADAAHEFAADSSLMNNERALYEAGVLYSSPTRGAYDPEHAQALLQRLLMRFPDTRFREDANDRLALVDSVLDGRTRAARERELETRIAVATGQMQRLRFTRDSAVARMDTLQRSLDRLNADLHARDEQINALKLELQRLKAIDLRRPPLKH